MYGALVSFTSRGVVASSSSVLFAAIIYFLRRSIGTADRTISANYPKSNTSTLLITSRLSYTNINPYRPRPASSRASNEARIVKDQVSVRIH